MGIVSRITDIFRTHKSAIVWGAIFILSVSASFAAGYITAKDASPAPIIIEKCSQVEQ